MINILFVDDEQNVLEGLQRMLRSMRHEWQMFYALDGVEALKILSENRVDVVVTDMKMPGMSGSQLLEEVRNRYPQIVRIILSGYAENAMILKSVGTAHQFITKPCDSEVLKEVVSRACALRNLLTDEKLRQNVSKMHTVPSLPTLYKELLAELNLDDPSIRKISQIIEKDIGMAVKVLQIVNSAFFGLRRTISDAGEAIRFLGLNTISSLALSIEVFSQFELKSNPGFLAKLWEHSISVGNTAKRIAQSEFSEMSNDAFTAGLLHDIGEVVLAVNMPENFDHAQARVVSENVSRIEAEKEFFESNHAQVGGYLLSLWGLPQRVVEAVAFHHKPSDIQAFGFSPLTAVHAANIFHRYPKEQILEQPESLFDVKYMTELNLMGKIAIWYEKFMQESD